MHHNRILMASTPSIERIAHEVIDSLSLSCPNDRCPCVLDTDPDACAAMKCPLCSTNYCFLCHATFLTSKDTHAHCVEAHGTIWPTKGVKHDAEIRLKATRLVAVLDQHPHDTHSSALKATSDILNMNALPRDYGAIRRLAQPTPGMRKRKRQPHLRLETKISLKDLSLVHMAKSGNFVAIEQLLSSCDGTPDTAFPRSTLLEADGGFNIVHVAVCNERPRMLSSIIVHAKARGCLREAIDTKTTAGWTPISLLCAKEHSDINMLEQLLEHDPDVLSRSPLIGAIRYGNPRHACLIINHVRHHKDKHSLYLTLREQSPLYKAAFHGHPMVVESLISAHDEMFDTQAIRSRFIDTGRAMHAACASTATTSASRTLLLCGANPTIHDAITGDTPLKMAIANGKLDIVWQLTYGLRLWPTHTPGIERRMLQTTDAALNGPLHWAVISGHTQMCNSIISFAARTLTQTEFETFLNYKNYDGDTPLLLAAAYDWYDIVNLFDNQPLVNFNIPNSSGYTPRRLLLRSLKPGYYIDTDPSSTFCIRRTRS